MLLSAMLDYYYCEVSALRPNSWLLLSMFVVGVCFSWVLSNVATQHPRYAACGAAVLAE